MPLVFCFPDLWLFSGREKCSWAQRLIKVTLLRVVKEVRGFGSQVHPGDSETPGFYSNKHRGGFALIWPGLLGWVRQFNSSAIGWQEMFLSCSLLVLPPSRFILYYHNVTLHD